MRRAKRQSVSHACLAALQSSHATRLRSVRTHNLPPALNRDGVPVLTLLGVLDRLLNRGGQVTDVLYISIPLLTPSHGVTQLCPNARQPWNRHGRGPGHAARTVTVPRPYSLFLQKDATASCGCFAFVLPYLPRHLGSVFLRFG
jgi:hypothetical protein